MIRRVQGVPSPRGVLALGMIRHSPPLPPRRGWRCADPGASPSSAAAAASGDPVTSRASPFRHGWRRWWMVRRVQGVPSTTAAGAGGSVIQRVRGVPSSAACGCWEMIRKVRGVPFRRGCGCGGRSDRARLWWYSALSTRYIGT